MLVQGAQLALTDQVPAVEDGQSLTVDRDAAEVLTTDRRWSSGRRPAAESQHEQGNKGSDTPPAQTVSGGRSPNRRLDADVISGVSGDHQTPPDRRRSARQVLLGARFDRASR